MSKLLGVCTDAYEIISKKMLINRMTIELLKHQMEFSKTSMEYNRISTQVAEKKIELIKKLDAIYEKQLKEFDEFRQKDCLDLHEEINELDIPSQELKIIIAKLNKLENEINNLIPKIQHIESTIPAEQMMTNYYISAKKNITAAASCAAEVADMGSLPDE